MANANKNNIKRFVENISEEVANDAYEGGGSGSATLKKVDTTEDYTINYAPLIDFLNKNGYDTSLSLNEMAEEGLESAKFPLAIDDEGSGYVYLEINIGDEPSISIIGPLSALISSGDGETPLDEIFAEAGTTVYSGSDYYDDYALPWFDLTLKNPSEEEEGE